MAVEVVLSAIAEYACVSVDGKLSVAGIIDTVTARPTARADGKLPEHIPMPRFYLAVTFTASLSDGLTHELSLGVRHEDGRYLLPPQVIGVVEFALNPHGRQLRSNIIVELPAIPLPSATADYQFEIIVNERTLAEVPLYFTLLPPEPA